MKPLPKNPGWVWFFFLVFFFVLFFFWCRMGNIFHPQTVAVTLGAQQAGKQLTRFPWCSACHLTVRCRGYWHSGAGKVELRSSLNQTVLGEGTCLRASYCRRAYRIILFQFLLLQVHNRVEGSCAHGIFLPLITWFLFIPAFPSQVKTDAFLVLLGFTVQKD